MNKKITMSPACEKYAGLYIHIPFCVRKCNYCDFLSAPASDEVKAAYLVRLAQDLEETFVTMRGREEQISTVYLGGGTPSILEEEQLICLITQVYQSGLVCQEAEFTMEVNPGTASYEKLRACKEAGVNRLSIGAQSFHNQELKLLGRIHDAKEAIDCFQMAREAGFTNINMDLMASLPGQSLDDFLDNVRKLIALGPEHISAYSLIIEEGTKFYELYGEDYYEDEGKEDLDRAMYQEAMALLHEAGYARYEISNYAKPGFESRHNSSYWTGTPYYGCGLGASSLIFEGDKWYRFRKQDDLASYLKGDFSELDKEILTKEARMEEFMFLGLRMTRGVSRLDFEKCFGVKLGEIYGDVLAELHHDGLIKFQEDRIALTEKGLDLANYCFSKFLLD